MHSLKVTCLLKYMMRNFDLVKDFKKLILQSLILIFYLLLLCGPTPVLRSVGTNQHSRNILFNNIHFTLCIKFTVTLIYVDADE